MQMGKHFYAIWLLTLVFWLSFLAGRSNQLNSFARLLHFYCCFQKYIFDLSWTHTIDIHITICPLFYFHDIYCNITGTFTKWINIEKLLLIRIHPISLTFFISTVWLLESQQNSFLAKVIFLLAISLTYFFIDMQ